MSSGRVRARGPRGLRRSPLRGNRCVALTRDYGAFVNHSASVRFGAAKLQSCGGRADLVDDVMWPDSEAGARSGASRIVLHRGRATCSTVLRRRHVHAMTEPVSRPDPLILDVWQSQCCYAKSFAPRPHELVRGEVLAP
jgi:hypothetical protein